MKLNIKLDMQYCVHCDDEYMPDVPRCGVCGADLISGKDLLSTKQNSDAKLTARLGNLTASDEIITIFKAKVGEVKRLEKLLKAENIGTIIVGDDTCGKGCCGGNVELKVRMQDARDALSIIEDDLDKATRIDDHELVAVDNGFDQSVVEHICPACGTTFATSTTTCPDCGLCFG